MIVCSCYAISDRELREAAAAGMSFRELEDEIGVGTDCGVCRSAVAEILGPERGEMSHAPPHSSRHKPAKKERT
jgi:bacterioferritin-associated ferredoxin